MLDIAIVSTSSVLSNHSVRRMRPEELVRLLKRRPFKPLRICTTDGGVFEVRHPDQVFVTGWRIEIAVEPNPQTGEWRRVEHFSPLHLARVEEFEVYAPGGTA